MYQASFLSDRSPWRMGINLNGIAAPVKHLVVHSSIRMTKKHLFRSAEGWAAESIQEPKIYFVNQSDNLI